MSQSAAPKRAVTPPKGRPTRSRHDRGPARTFGPQLQWAAFAAVGAVVFAILFVRFG